MTDCCDETAWLDARITKTKALIEAYEDAVLAFADSNVQSYQLDTGQTRQLVTRAQLGSVQLTLSRLEARLATLLARRGGCAQFNMRPGW
jgi:hypothetical protein